MWAELNHLSDAELAELVRRGETEAFDVLFRRYHDAAIEYATRFAGADHAADRVAEGFSRVLRALLAGNGPDDNVRGYLFTAVRNAHVDVVRRGRRELPIDDLGVEIPAVEDVEDDVLARVDASPIRRAFARLRPSWREVLWRTVVIGESHEQVAGRLGTNTNAVAVLSFRAREGLRQAYLAEHVKDRDDRNCSRVAPHLPKYVRGQLGPKRERAVEEHLDECRACRVVVLDLTRINDDLAAVLTPAVLLAVPGVLGGGLAVKGALLGFFSWLPIPRGNPGLAVGATAATAAVAAVAAGFALTAGPDRDRPRADEPMPSSPAATEREAPPPGRPADPPARQKSRPQPAPAVPVVQVSDDPQPPPAQPRPTREPTPPPPPPTTPPPLPTTPPPPPANPPILTHTGTSAQGSRLLRYARLDWSLTPQGATGVVVRASNVHSLVVVGNATSCPPEVTPDGEARVECALSPDAPEPVSLSLHLVVADPSSPVTGSVTVTGGETEVTRVFTVTPE